MTTRGFHSVDLRRPRLIEIHPPTETSRHQTIHPPVLKAPPKLGHPGTCPEHPALYMFLTDDSASITGMAGNDPLARRYDEVRRATEHIGRDCDCGKELVAIIHFDYPSCRDVPPQRLHRLGMHRLRSGLRSDGLPGSSDLGPALDKAEHLARQHPDATATLVVMTDFFLTDRDPRTVLDQLISFDGHVHAVSLGAEPPTRLLQDDHVTTSMITSRSEPGTTAQAVFDALMTYRQRTTP